MASFWIGAVEREGKETQFTVVWVNRRKYGDTPNRPARNELTEPGMIGRHLSQVR